MLEGLKEPYIFTSNDLIKIVEITPSLKTRIAMITMIAPRLSDPSAHVSTFTDMFRFAEQKQAVEDVLKARMHAIQSSKFTKSAGSGLLRGGPGGRGGRRSSLTDLGRGSAAAARMRPVSTSVTTGLNRKPSDSSMSPKIISKKTPTKTAEDAKTLRKNPEVSPEDSQSENSSPFSLKSRVESPAEEAFISPVKTVPVVEHIITTPYATSTASVVHNSKPAAVLYDSPNTDSETSTLCSSASPTEGSSAAKTEIVVAEAKPALSPVPEVAPVEPVPIPVSVPTSTIAPIVAEETGVAVPSTITPVPFVITARAPQRGPPVAPRRGSTHTNSSTDSTPAATPTITPSTSQTNLASMASSSQHSSAAPSPVTAGSAHSASNHSPMPPVTHSQGGLSTSIAAYKDFDLAPMVADCKPEKGVSSLKSMFSGNGGTSPSLGRSLPPKPPMDATPAKLRAGDNSTFAYKPATSTASSTLRSYRTADTTYAGSIDARSNAPAPIIIPGATLSLAEMRAKFSGSSSANTSPGAYRLSTGRGTSHSEAASPSAAHPVVLVRRHSECAIGSINPTDGTILAAIAAANAAYASAASSNASSSPSTSSSETAGAGADLASRCATALNMTRAEFVALDREEAVFSPDNSIDDSSSSSKGGAVLLPQYSYREVVRRNYVKAYEELNQKELELYVCDGDFFAVFSRSKVSCVSNKRAYCCHI